MENPCTTNIWCFSLWYIWILSCPLEWFSFSPFTHTVIHYPFIQFLEMFMRSKNIKLTKENMAIMYVPARFLLAYTDETLHKQIYWKFEWQKRIHIVDSDYILPKIYNRPQIFVVVHFFSCVIDYRLIGIHIPEPSLLHILKIPCEFWPGRSFLLTTTTSTIKETKEWMALGNFFCLLHLRLVWKCQFWCKLGWWTKHFSWQACNPL